MQNAQDFNSGGQLLNSSCFIEMLIIFFWRKVVELKYDESKEISKLVLKMFMLQLTFSPLRSLEMEGIAAYEGELVSEYFFVSMPFIYPHEPVPDHTLR